MHYLVQYMGFCWASAPSK